MKKLIFVVAAVLVLSLVIAVPVFAMPGAPDFSPHIYADGVVWGTKVTTPLQEPKWGKNEESYDKLFIILWDDPTDDPDMGLMEYQLPVGEAGPGNPMYNGGRWWTHTAVWNQAGIDAHGIPLPILMSYDDVMLHAGLGHLDITPAPPPGAPAYFSCPLLPVK